jgi:uncharacterized protein
MAARCEAGCARLRFFLFSHRAVLSNRAVLQKMSQRSVAVIGASSDRRKFGNKAVRAYQESGFTVFPVNPRETMIEGLRAYRAIDEITEPIDIVSVYVPPAVAIKLLPAIARKKPNELWLNPGSESDDLVDAAADLKLRTVVACSISALGISPEELAER